MNAKKENNSIIQVLRALAIILVLIHHSIVNINASNFGIAFDNIIICFHMPIFFIISGYLFETKLKKYLENGKFEFIKKKFKHLIFPYLFWTILLWIGVRVFCLINKSFIMKIGFYPMSVLELLKGIFTYEVYYTQHLWFLYVLFCMFVINIICSRINKKWILCISFICGISTAIIKYPNIITRLLLWSPFFIIGRCLYNSNFYMEYLKNKKIFSNKKNILNIFIVILFTVLVICRLVLLNNNSYIYMKIINKVITYSIGITGSYLLYIIAIIIHNSNLRRLFKKIGDYSYEIYLIHNPYFVAILSIVLSKIIKLPSIICLSISIIVGIVLPIIMAKMIYKYLKNKSFILLGK